MRKKFFKILLLVGILITIGPILIAIAGSFLGFLLGCTDGAGGPGTCAIGGQEMGNSVWTAIMMHWYIFLTFIPGIIIVGIGLLGTIFSPKEINKM